MAKNFSVSVLLQRSTVLRACLSVCRSDTISTCLEKYQATAQHGLSVLSVFHDPARMWGDAFRRIARWLPRKAESNYVFY
jgi:hypothetical protein